MAELPVAFDGFDVDKVAAYDAPDFERLLADASIVRNGRKILATISNAQTFQLLRSEHGSFHRYLRSMDGWSYDKRREELVRRFASLGRTGCFVFLWCVDEEVPQWEDR
jgi:3-methyladenine DNA glycosylase Tag